MRREPSIKSTQCRTIHLGVRRKVLDGLLQPRICTCIYIKPPKLQACQCMWLGVTKLVPASLPFTQALIVLSQRIRNNNSLPRSTRFFLPTASLYIATRRQSELVEGRSGGIIADFSLYQLQLQLWRCRDLKLGEKEMMTSYQQGRAISH